MRYRKQCKCICESVTYIIKHTVASQKPQKLLVDMKTQVQTQTTDPVVQCVKKDFFYCPMTKMATMLKCVIFAVRWDWKIGRDNQIHKFFKICMKDFQALKL